MNRTFINIFAVIALLFLHNPAFADDDLIDSLKRRINEAPDSVKIGLLNDLSRTYWDISLDQSLKFAKEALRLAEYANDQEGIADAINRIGNAEHLRSNYQEAIIQYERSLDMRQQMEDWRGVLGSCNNLYLAYNVIGNREKAHEYAERSVELSISLGNPSEIAYYTNIMGSIKYRMHDFDEAKVNIEKALQIYESLGNLDGMAGTLNTMGSMYQRMNLYDQAQECFFEALSLYRQTENITGVALAKNNIGIIHKSLDHFDTALEYFTSSLELLEESGSLKGNIASLLNNIGIIWYEKGEHEKALDYYDRALNLYDEINNIEGIATITHNKGILHTRLGNYHEAYESYMRSVDINSSIGDRYSMANNYNNLGELHILTGKFNEAQNYLDESLEVALSLNAKSIICENYLFQSRLFRELNEAEKALFFYEKYDNYRDSIFTADTGTKIAELQVRNKRENQLNELDILEKNRHIRQLQIIKQNTALLYHVGIAVLIGIFVFIVMMMYRHRKKLNLALNDKNRQLEEANQELITSEKNLQRLNATKDKFFSIIAHDLKNPFNALLAFSETLNQNYENLSREEINTYIDIINKSAINLYQLLENLLDWSKIQTGTFVFNPEKFNLKEITDTVINAVKINAERKNIAIYNETEPGITCFADKNAVATVIRNLASNAVKFTHKNGVIKITAKERKDIIEVAVIDNGIGIGPSEQKKLFKIDYNITTIGTGDERGTGLGLVLCKEFTENSGGKLWLESEIDKGSKFTFTIPKTSIS